MSVSYCQRPGLDACPVRTARRILSLPDRPSSWREYLVAYFKAHWGQLGFRYRTAHTRYCAQRLLLVHPVEDTNSSALPIVALIRHQQRDVPVTACPNNGRINTPLGQPPLLQPVTQPSLLINSLCRALSICRPTVCLLSTTEPSAYFAYSHLNFN